MGMARGTRVWDSLKLGGPILALILLGFAVAYLFVGPAPPERITLATGEAGGAYALFGSRYQEILSENGIELVLRESAGSAENLALLRERDIDAAFVQGGVAEEPDRDAIESLGSLYFEPLWGFHRVDLQVDRLSDLAELRVSAGPEGSGTRAVVLRLLSANGIASAPLALPNDEAVAGLREGALDAVFLIGSLESPVVRDLLLDERIEPLSFRRADAYERTHRFLSKLVLPEGVVDYAANVPRREIVLVAATTNLAIRDDVHPALLDLLVQAAARVHGAGGVFEDPGAFPTPRYIDFPLNTEARRYYKHGPPFLQRYLPFWQATAIDRLKVMLIPLVALLIPLFRAFPPLYRWRVRSRIYRWYTELREIDPRDSSAFSIERALAEARRIEDEVARVPAPASYAQELYDLRLHIDFIRRRLSELDGRNGHDTDPAP